MSMSEAHKAWLLSRAFEMVTRSHKDAIIAELMASGETLSEPVRMAIAHALKPKHKRRRKADPDAILSVYDAAKVSGAAYWGAVQDAVEQCRVSESTVKRAVSDRSHADKFRASLPTPLVQRR